MKTDVHTPDLIAVQIDGKEIFVPRGSTVGEILHQNRPCGGRGICGKCKVRASGALSPVSSCERERLTTQELEQGIRLACRTRIEGFCRIEGLSAEGGEENILTSGMPHTFAAMPDLAGYGVAVDIGTTTLAARLYSADGRLLSQTACLNPQMQWGADVISRIEAALAGKEKDLRDALLFCIDRMLTELANQAGVSCEHIGRAVMTGNTVMLHLLTGTSPAALAAAPFSPHRLFNEYLSAGELSLSALSPDVPVFLPACISAFVGADTVCAVLATELCTSSTPTVLVDIGTNGEICLFDREKLYVASTAAGPAFEGVGISYGMRAEKGAIHRVSTEEGRPVCEVIGEKEATGICGSGLIDAVAALLSLGMMDETGALQAGNALLCDHVFLSQNDIRAVQMAKSAISAGMQTVLQAAGLTAPDRVILAGGFGSYLSVENAVRIGMLPSYADGRTSSVGNAALDGAATLLFEENPVQRCAQIVTRAVPVDLATDPAFAELYMMGMLF